MNVTCKECSSLVHINNWEDHVRWHANLMKAMLIIGAEFPETEATKQAKEKAAMIEFKH